ncbi:hypothetical protein [Streptomyces sp. NBC_01508]|uniref:hypothetical protein n=1 Tax=Streptomyces sp. NBC_01508 TaxID=2903888 RepID=UPI00387003B3
MSNSLVPVRSWRTWADAPVRWAGPLVGLAINRGVTFSPEPDVDLLYAVPVFGLCSVAGVLLLSGVHVRHRSLAGAVLRVAGPRWARRRERRLCGDPAARHRAGGWRRAAAGRGRVTVGAWGVLVATPLFAVSSTMAVAVYTLPCGGRASDLGAVGLGIVAFLSVLTAGWCLVALLVPRVHIEERP